MFQQQQQHGGGGVGRGGRQAPPPINTSHQHQQQPSSMRQGRFLSPQNQHRQQQQQHGASPSRRGQYGGGYHQYPQQQHQQHPSHYDPHGQVLSPTSQVRFEEETASAENHSATFLFDEDEWVDDSEDDDEYQGREEDHADQGGGGVKSDNRPARLPTEAQLTLLCLDYLRDLRRTYHNREDMLNAEGLDADYVALAAWSLSRAFVRPNKLRHEVPGISKVSEVVSKGKRPIEVQYFGGGGLSGMEDEPFGNDATYRQLEDDITEDAAAKIRGRLALSDSISVPSMEDVTKEVLLRHPSEPEGGLAKRSRSDEEDEQYYEHNDGHRSNAHRFYLLNGLASDASAAVVEGLMSPRPGGGALPPDIHGSPLTFCEIAAAGLSSLRARTRLEADKDMVSDPLFGQFVQAAAAGGFFQEKREDRRRSKSSTPTNLSPEEEARRSRLIYEEKYRKVVNKFRTKLATKEAQMLLGMHPTTPQFGNSPHHFHSASPSRMGSAYRIMSGNASVSSMGSRGGGGANLEAVLNVGDVADRQRRRRERRIERVKSLRGELPEVKKAPPGIPMMDAEPEDGGDDQPLEKKIPVNTLSLEEKEKQLSRKEQQLSRKQKPKQTKDPFTPSAANLPHYQEAERLSAAGNALMQQKSFQQALESYTSAIQLAPAGPNSHVYYSNRSAAYLSLNQYETSIRDSERSLALKPDYAKAHSRLGLAYFASGRYDEAVESYEASLEIDPENGWTMDHLEKARERLREMEEQMMKVVEQEEAEEVVAAEGQNADDDEDNWPTPFDGNAAEQEASAAEEHHVEEEDDPEIIARQTQEADQHKNRGNDHMSKKEFELALQEYDLAISASPNGPNSHVYYSNRAAAHCYLAQYDLATQDCLTSIELCPTYEKAHARLGLSLFFGGDYEGAAEAYERSLELDPNNKASMSYLRKARGRLEEQREREREDALRQQQQRQQQQVGEEGESLGDETGLTSIVTSPGDGSAGGQEGTNPSSQSNQQAFDPFATDE